MREGYRREWLAGRLYTGNNVAIKSHCDCCMTFTNFAKALEKLSNHPRQVHFLRAKLVHFYILTTSRCQFTCRKSSQSTQNELECRFPRSGAQQWTNNGVSDSILAAAAAAESETICLAFLCHVHVSWPVLRHNFCAEIIIFTTFTTCFTKLSMSPSVVLPCAGLTAVYEVPQGATSARFNSLRFPKTITV